MYLPAILSADTVEGLAAEQGLEKPWIYRLLLLGAVAGLASLPLIELDVAVRAPGLVRPANERVELRPAVGGLVERVLARDNEQVKTGQPLLVLASVDLEERLARNQALREAIAARIVDLQQASAADPDKPDLTWGTPAIGEEWNAYRAQRKTCQLAANKAAAEQERCRLLTEKGIVARQELENAYFESERWQSEARLLRAQTLARWQTRLQEETTTLAQLESEAQRLMEEQSHYTIRAPATGVLVNFTGWSPGGYLAAGQNLGSISPDEALVVETRISSRDAGLVRTGQTVRLQVDAYDYTWWGTLEGVVTAIGGDVIVPEGAAIPGFKVCIHPKATHLSLPNGARAELRKGLTVSTRFIVARRSVLQLLYDESGAWLNPQDRRPS